MRHEVNIGLVGYKMMGQAHSSAYKRMPMFFKTEHTPHLKAICGRTQGQLQQIAGDFGWQSYETSWEKLIQRKDIDLVDITTPNSTHKEIALAAAAEGKHILCEKPLAMNLKEAESMLQAVNDAGVKHMVCFNYRKVPAIALAKQLIDEGRLGRIYQFRGRYLVGFAANPNFPLVWRLQKEIAGSGAHGDLNSHLIDMARFLVGEFDQVMGMQETFIKKRPRLKTTDKLIFQLTAKASDEMGEVTVDDATLFLAKFANGALGSFEATRVASGHRACQSFEINGSRGSLSFSLEDINTLWLYSSDDLEGTKGFRKILVAEPVHPYMNAWQNVAGIIAYEHTFVHLIYDLMRALDKGENPSPSFVDGVECQRVLEAVERSIGEGRWVKVKSQLAQGA